MNRFAAITLLAATTAVNAHGFVKEWGVGSANSKAQKTDKGSSSMRQGSDNTGWIGSNFLNTAAIACSSSNTPFGTVAAPDGTFFSSPDQGAGQSLAVKSGDKLQFVISGNPGEGFPHPNGHVQTYMADCGGDCKSFDVTKGQFFKIQSEKNGIQNTLRPGYDGSVDGNRYNVALPTSLPPGNYIVRFELIAFGQSSSVEGNQDQYYPYCGQVKVGGSGNKKRDLEARALFERATKGQTITFPGGYKNGNIDQNTTPGPAVISNTAGVSSGGASGGSSGGSGSGSGSGTTTGTGQGGGVSGGQGGQGTGSVGAGTGGSSSLSLPASAGECAATCLNIKISEKTTLGASSCGDADGACMCGVETFTGAFDQCVRDNCGGEADSAIAALISACSSMGSSGAGAGQSAAATGGSSSSDSSSSGGCKSKRSRSADAHLSSGKSKRLHRVRKHGKHPATLALRTTSH